MKQCKEFLKYENNLEELLNLSDANEFKDFFVHLKTCKDCQRIYALHKEIKNTFKSFNVLTPPQNLHFNITNAIFKTRKQPVYFGLFNPKTLSLSFAVFILFMFLFSTTKINNLTKNKQVLIPSKSTKNKFLKKTEQILPKINKNKPFKTKTIVLKPKLTKKIKINKNTKYKIATSLKTKKYSKSKNQKKLLIAKNIENKINPPNLKKSPEVEFVLSFAVQKNSSDNINENNIQIELSVDNGAYFTAEDKHNKTKQIVFNSDLSNLPEISVIPVTSNSKIIKVKGKIITNRQTLFFNKTLKVPENKNSEIENNNTEVEVLTFVPTHKEIIPNQNNALNLSVATGEMKILPITEKNFPIISENLGKTKIVLSNGEMLNLDKIQVIN